MFSRALSVGTRLKDWKTNPTRSRRSCVSFRSESRARSTPHTRTEPDVGVSRPAITCISVDFPEPDGPITAVKRRSAMSRLTPASAWTAASPAP